MKKVYRVDLGVFPTPLQKMDRLSKHYNKTIYFKRDDLGSLGFGGNKLRKLEYLAHDALSQGCDTLLTVGGIQTNHGRLTAAVAAKLGLRCILILSGEKPEYLSGNLLLDHLMGADVRFSQNLDESIKQAVAEYEHNGHNVYTIPLGGSTPLGALGYFNLMHELKAQLEEQSYTPKHLFVTAGSLGTLAGIILGNKFFELNLQVHGVKIYPADEQEDIAAVINLANEAAKLLGLGVTIDETDVDILTKTPDYPDYLSGYNVPDTRAYQIIEEVAQAEGILLDPCYTSKGFLGLKDFILNHPAEDDYLFIHTGGNVGLWTKEHLDEFQSLAE